VAGRRVSDREWSLAEPTGVGATAAASAGSYLRATASPESIPFYMRNEASRIAANIAKLSDLIVGLGRPPLMRMGRKTSPPP
jgi:hypothetical protein